VTQHTLSGPPPAWAALPPIGRPIAGSQIYLLDALLQPVPIGAVGEIYIGGEGLARGYTKRPELTAAQFVPDPFGTAGARLYRTGDLARYLADGTIAFLGRRDEQVKVRGFRIELGEIEAVLATHPQVRECVVVARAERGHQRLVAYVEPRTKNLEPNQSQEDNLLGSKSPGGHPVLGSALREFLAQRLPDYMLPAAFVQLDALPLTASGKVDRRALPAPVFTPEQAVELVPPRNPVEQALAAIWTNVLQIEQVGVHNNFFALGGDSILSLQMIAQAQQRGLKITPRQIFQHQTIAELAAVISADDAPPPAPESNQPPPAAPGEVTPADFPRAKLSQKDLNTLANRLGKSGKRRP